MKLSAAVLCALVAVQAAVLLATVPTAQASELEVGYYSKKCKGVENVVKWHVIKAIKANRRTGAALVRLIFHDCFVRGCDGSVLLDASYDNPHPEKEAPVNIGLAAFDVLEEIKAAVEKRCPGVVSCSDILIYAARDAASILSNGHVHFAVPAGRLDGFVSKAEEAQAELPDSTHDVQQLIDNFARKNFTVEELVILTGAHSIGQGHCSSFTGRLSEPPSQINPAYRDLLNYKCPQGSNPPVANNVRDEDYGVVARYMPGFTSRVRKIPDFLDNSFYHNNLAKIVTFHSDWTLLTNKEAFGHVVEYAENATLWDEDFSDSLLKLSKLPMPAGSTGEIRNKCSVVNHRLY
ncbi:Peroxidase 2 [Zea mays]|uniref:Peroxidase n=2 Tax=Zea mays TaxID=4577 RepID=C0P4S1_MAIZE|nr:peroxidase 1 precursor [Zea mays]ACN27987.1 unknown [Zea mays]ONM31594.1 Peroxidase 2 [Zea mays]PWZ33114.1 Peroxidase 2 [Zea mays]